MPDVQGCCVLGQGLGAPLGKCVTGHANISSICLQYSSHTCCLPSCRTLRLCATGVSCRSSQSPCIFSANNKTVWLAPLQDTANVCLIMELVPGDNLHARIYRGQGGVCMSYIDILQVGRVVCQGQVGRA